LGSCLRDDRLRDESHYFDGAKSCRLKLPPPIPAKDFRSIVVYDPQTRSMLQQP